MTSPSIPQSVIHQATTTTVSDLLVIGFAMDATPAVLPDPRSLAVRVPPLLAGVALNGLATGLYIAASFGRARGTA